MTLQERLRDHRISDNGWLRRGGADRIDELEQLLRTIRATYAHGNVGKINRAIARIDKMLGGA